MSQERLSGLALLSIENERAQNLDFRKLYNSLPAQKQHRKFAMKLRLRDCQGVSEHTELLS